jgi:signal transduction histidine kinase
MARNAAFAFNAGVALAMLLLDTYLAGFGPAYLWPEAPKLSNTLLAIGLAGPSLFGPFYLAHFLNDDGAYRRMKPLDQIWPLLAVGFLILNFLGVEIVSLLALTATWIIMTLYYAARIFVLSSKGNERATVLLLPLFGAVIPAMIAGSLNSWMQPDFGIMQDHLTELALVLETLTSTLALAYLLRISRWREHEALRQLNLQSVVAKQTLLRTIDADRTRMAAELHDTAGQGLLLAASRLKQISTQSPDIDVISGMVRQTLTDLRSLSHDLHPATLEHLGLSDALASLVQSMRQTTETKIEYLALPDDIRFNAIASLHIYRIAQELLTNAINHAQASQISLETTVSSEHLLVVVSDDGVGKSPMPRQTGIGSIIIEERVSALGGHLTTSLETGRRVRVLVPLDGNLESEDQ